VRRVICIGNYTYGDVSLYTVLLKFKVTSSNMIHCSQCTRWITFS